MDDWQPGSDALGEARSGASRNIYATPASSPALPRPADGGYGVDRPSDAAGTAKKPAVRQVRDLHPGW
jgi:hypothetical protein